MLQALSKHPEVKWIHASREAVHVSHEVREGYARAFQEMFLYLAELDSRCPEIYRTRRNLLDGFLPDEIDVTPLIKSIEAAFSALELDLVERLLQTHRWLGDFEAGGVHHNNSCRTVFQQGPEHAAQLLSEFLAIVLGSQLLLQLEEIVRAKTGEANGVNPDRVLLFINQKPKWTTEKFLTLWVQDVPGDSLRARLCKNIECIAELEEFAEWESPIKEVNLLKNTRTQFLHICVLKLKFRNAQLKDENETLKRERDDLWGENMYLQDDYFAKVIERAKQHPARLVSQSETLVLQTEELIRRDAPIQCMIYREHLETLCEDERQSDQTQGDAWRAYWSRAVDAAETNQDLIWTRLLEGSRDHEEIKSAGNALFKRLSGPIHVPGKSYGKFKDWCYVKEREILPVIKDMALEKTERKIKDHEKRESWRPQMMPEGPSNQGIHDQ